MKVVCNAGADRVIDLLRLHLKWGSQLDTVTHSFCLFAFAEMHEACIDVTEIIKHCHVADPHLDARFANTKYVHVHVSGLLLWPPRMYASHLVPDVLQRFHLQHVACARIAAPTLHGQISIVQADDMPRGGVDRVNVMGRIQ